MELDDELYQEIILEHYKSKEHRGEPEGDFMRAEGANPVCGDDLEIFVKLNGNILEAISFDGIGCSISSASADMLCASLKGKSVEEAMAIVGEFKAMLLEDKTPSFPDELSDLEAMLGVKKFPVRIKCALLAWNTFSSMLEKKS